MRGTNNQSVKTFFKASFSAIILLLSVSCALAAQYTIPNLKIEAPHIKVILGEKMTASGGATLTTPDLVINSETATCFFHAEGGRISHFQASGNVRFKAKQKRKDGSLMEVEGEGDSLVYEIETGKATISGRRDTRPGAESRKAHAHAVEMIPGKKDQPASKPIKRSYDIYAFTINLDLKENTLEASGAVQIDASLPDTDSKENTAK